MKTAELVLIGAAGLGAYFLLKGNSADTPAETALGYMSGAPDNPISKENPLLIYDNTNKGTQPPTKITSNRDAVNWITSQLQSGKRIKSAGESITKPSAIGQSSDGSLIMSGVSRSLDSGQVLRTTTRTAPRDTSGLTAMDKIILKNKGQKATKANAISAGLL
jgi:hypothetical protein